MSFAPLSLLSPLAANGVIVSLVIGPCLLGEVVRPKEWAVALSILTSVVVTIVSGPKHSRGYHLDAILHRCWDPVVLTSEAFFLILVLVCCCFLHRSSMRRQRRLRVFMWALSSGVVCAQGFVFLKLASSVGRRLVEHPWLRHEAIFWPAAAALGFFILCSLFFSLAQLGMLNKGMAEFDAVMILPMYTCIIVIAGILNGAIFYEDLHSLAPWQWPPFLAGLCGSLTFCALFPWVRISASDGPSLRSSMNESLATPETTRRDHASRHTCTDSLKSDELETVRLSARSTNALG